MDSENTMNNLVNYLHTLSSTINPAMSKSISNLSRDLSDYTTINTDSISILLKDYYNAIKSLSKTTSLPFESSSIKDLGNKLEKISAQLPVTQELFFTNIELPTVYFDILNSISRLNSQNKNNEFTSNAEKLADIVNDSIRSLEEADFNQDNDNCIALTEPLAKFISSVDNSVELPESDSEKVVCLKNSTNPKSFWNVVSFIFSIVNIALLLYQIYTGTALENLHHAELMKEAQAQTIEAQRQTQEEIKQTIEAQEQTTLLRQITENTIPIEETSTSLQK